MAKSKHDSRPEVLADYRSRRFGKWDGPNCGEVMQIFRQTLPRDRTTLAPALTLMTILPLQLAKKLWSSSSATPMLSRWAKALMMLQASISLTTLAMLAARAVNICSLIRFEPTRPEPALTLCRAIEASALRLRTGIFTDSRVPPPKRRALVLYRSSLLFTPFNNPCVLRVRYEPWG